MSIKLDSILVVDLEATCWEGDPPPGEVSDIIEIGLAVVNLRDLVVTASESFLLKPPRSTVSEFCTKLTTITQAMLDDSGGQLTDAVAQLRRKYKSSERTWASYGDYDRKMMESCCRDLGVPYPFGPRHINVKNLIAVGRGWPKELGMAQALDYLDIPLEGTHHRGVDDAINIAKIFTKAIGGIRRLAG
jgi:inhibitor of KinA sporulation pathway (predicted exonuclease)